MKKETGGKKTLRAIYVKERAERSNEKNARNGFSGGGEARMNVLKDKGKIRKRGPYGTLAEARDGGTGKGIGTFRKKKNAGRQKLEERRGGI